MKKHFLLLSLFSLFVLASAQAAEQTAESRLAACLKSAEEWPDMAKANAEAWGKKGGGDQALLCRAYAQMHSDDPAAAAQAFTYLAQKRPPKDHMQRAKLFEQAGLAQMKAHDSRAAEASFNAALRDDAANPDYQFDRAAARLANDKLWEALDDLNGVLAHKPTHIEALRLRGQIWIKLGYDSQGKADILYAEQIATGGDPHNKGKK